jgi:arginine exporter protein ArgO
MEIYEARSLKKEGDNGLRSHLGGLFGHLQAQLVQLWVRSSFICYLLNWLEPRHYLEEFLLLGILGISFYLWGRGSYIGFLES